MRRILAVVFAVASATALFAQAPAATKTTLPTPRPAGEFVIHMNDGSQKLLSSYKGKVVLVAFMYTTCSHCQHTAGILAKVNNDYAAKGVQILGVAFDQDAQKGVPAFLKMTGANFPVGFSTPDQVVKFMHAYGDYYVPMMAFIDRAGTIRTQVISYGEPNGEADKFLGDEEEANVHKELDKLLKAPVHSTTATKAPKM
jgi:cytochrome oxidase Cu insertion factor (SCO1/SenC/PrrC family)